MGPDAARPLAEAATIERIASLRRMRDAVILAHSYQPPEIQDIADFVGDSLELSRAAAATPHRTVVFCGVRFMAETAYILAPEKTILMPAPDAGCPLADCMTPEDLGAMQESFPCALPVVYVNSSVEVKALAYSCCTSANASAVVEGVPADEIIFGPDRNLGLFVERRTGKKMRIFPGSCPPHARLTAGDIARAREDWPDAEVLVHPETPPECWDAADHVVGTGGMIARVAASGASRFIVGTEEGMAYRLGRLFPNREFRTSGSIRCPNMKKITPESVASALETMETAVRFDESLRAAAHASVLRMASIG